LFIKISPVRVKSPSYSIKKAITVNPEILEKKKELQKNIIEQTKKSWEDKKIKFIDDISISYENIHKPIGSIRYHKVIFITFYIKIYNPQF
jgi:hypothetical protein